MHLLCCICVPNIQNIVFYVCYNAFHREDMVTSLCVTLLSASAASSVAAWCRGMPASAGLGPCLVVPGPVASLGHDLRRLAEVTGRAGAVALTSGPRGCGGVVGPGEEPLRPVRLRSRSAARSPGWKRVLENRG